MSTSNKNLSGTVQVFPASRRDVQFYTSRINSEDNIRRPINVSNVYNRLDYPGSFIWEYVPANGVGSKPSADNPLVDVEFFIGGYYIRLNNFEKATAKDPSESGGGLLGTINTWLYVNPGVYTNQTLWVFIEERKDINSTATATNGNEYSTTYTPVSGRVPTGNYKSRLNDFYEANITDGKDSNNNYRLYGLGYQNNEPQGKLKIPLLVPNPDDGDKPMINPSLDGSGHGNSDIDPYKPWFLSSATWAAGKYSDKNKIWVDSVYNVPHVCIRQNDKQVWLPLGAVYKSSNDI